jgi:UDP-glucose 4-epimerase
MKLLVTGGAGFIGSHFLELLHSDKNYEVVVLDNLSSGFKENVPQGMKLVVADIRSQKIETLFKEEHFDAVVHLAAQTMVPYSIEHPDEDCEINLAGLINVLENCRKYKVKTVLFASSAAVYGNNESVPLQEELTLMPMSFYGITKMTSEHYLRVYHELYGINAVVFRFANVYGERQGEGGEGGVVSIFCKLLAAGKSVTVYGNGDQTRDFVYAGDVAAALKAGLLATGYQTINVSTEYETSVNQLLEAFAEVAADKLEVHHAAARQGDIFRSALANARLKEILGVTPQMQLKEGIQKTYHDYVKRGK